jgi:hypothetical protein
MGNVMEVPAIRTINGTRVIREGRRHHSGTLYSVLGRAAVRSIAKLLDQRA